MRIDVEPAETTCPIEAALQIISGRWKFLIVRELLTGTKRFSELQRALHGVTQKMLTQQLRELEQHGVLTRTVYPIVPPKVEYTLTSRGENLRPVMAAMHDWGRTFLREQPGNADKDITYENDSVMSQPNS